MRQSRYYVRIQPGDYPNFLEYMERNGINGNLLSVDMGAGERPSSNMMSLNLNAEEASALRLSFSLIGFLNFNRALSRQIDK